MSQPGSRRVADQDTSQTLLEAGEAGSTAQGTPTVPLGCKAGGLGPGRDQPVQFTPFALDEAVSVSSCSPSQPYRAQLCDSDRHQRC